MADILLVLAVAKIVLGIVVIVAIGWFISRVKPW